MKKILATALTLIVILGLSTQAAQAESPFGVAPSTGSSWSPSRWTSLLTAAGVSNVRGFNEDLSYTGDHDQLTSAGMQVSGILMTGNTFPVDDLDGWRSYIDRELATYPDVTHWEVWNEPPNFSVDHDPSHYATLVETAYDEVKRINPSLQVGIAGKATDIAWLGKAIEAGALGHFDYLTLHPYERVGIMEAGSDAQFMAIVPQVRAMLAANGSAQVPIRFTELGLSGDNSADDQVAQSDALIKAYSMSLVQGVQQIDWFEPMDGDNDQFGLVSSTGVLRPSYIALKALIGEVGQDPTPLGWYTNANGTTAMIFKSGSNVVLAAWASDGANSATLNFTRNAVVTDPATGITSVANSITLDGRARLIRLSGNDAANWRGKASWTAQYGSAFGATTVGDAKTWLSKITATPGGSYQGLELLTDLPTDSAAGRTAWHVAGTDQAVVRFAVSPQLAAYTGKTVKVTAVLRGDDDANAGFNIAWDSTNAYPSVTSRGWYHVAPGQWQTYTWTLDKFAPTGAYGYNLSLRSDGACYQNYRIASLTVSVVK